MLRLFRRHRDEDRQAAARARQDELLSAYLDGELSEVERERLEVRLSQDPALRAELRAMQSTMSLMRELPQVAAPRNFILSESMIERQRPAREMRRSRPEPRRGASAWAAPLLTAATAVVSLLFIVVLAGDLLLVGGDLASAPAPGEGLPGQEREAAPKIALEEAPAEEGPPGDVEAEEYDSEADRAADVASPTPASEEPAAKPVPGPLTDEESREEPEMEMAVEEEGAVGEATEVAQAPAGAEGTSPPAAEGDPAEETPAPAIPTVAPTVTSVTALTPTIPAEAPVVSEDELGLVEPTPQELEVTPRLVQEERETDGRRLPSLFRPLGPWPLARVLEVALGLAVLVLIVATILAWRVRQS